MLPATLMQFVTIIGDLLIFVFFVIYILRLHTKEKLIEKERSATDSNYHHIVDDAIAKERKILEDAAYEANQIIAGTKYVATSSKDSVDLSLKKMEGALQHEANATSQEFSKTYADSLQQVAKQSLADFQNVTHVMEEELQKQTREFRESLLPQLEKELDDYKKLRLQQADRTVTHIIQEVSQQILNKSLPLEDHERLLLESLEKAKKEGVFD
jgi:hypothetical protein